MYLDKEVAIELASKARQVISKLHEWKPDAPDMEEERQEITNAIIDLEYNLEKLDKAIEECPTK